MRINRIKFAAEMAKADIKVYELAEKAGISRATVTAIRNGKSCRAETAKKISGALGVPVEEITGI